MTHLMQVDDYMYELTVDSIHEIFKGYGEVRKIAIFQKNNQWQALVQYPDHQARPHVLSITECSSRMQRQQPVLTYCVLLHLGSTVVHLEFVVL